MTLWPLFRCCCARLPQRMLTLYWKLTWTAINLLTVVGMKFVWMHCTNLEVEGVDISSNCHGDFTAKMLTRWISGYTNTFTFTTIWLQAATNVIFSQLKYSARIQRVLTQQNKKRRSGPSLVPRPLFREGGGSDLGTRLVWTLWL